MNNHKGVLGRHWLAALALLLAVSCDGPEQTTNPNPNPGPVIPGEPVKKTWKDIPQIPIRAATGLQIYAGGAQGYADNIITRTATGVANVAYDMRTNMNTYAFWKGFDEFDPAGFPSDEFSTAIGAFTQRSFAVGHNAPSGRAVFGDYMLSAIFDLNGIVDEKDRALFSAYANAYRGVNFMSARHQTDDDYTTQFDLGEGMVTMADLLQNVNDSSNGTINYPLNGKYPTDLRAGASALVADADSAYPHMVNDVVTLSGNFEQLLGMLQRARALGYDTKFTQEALNAISRATNGSIHAGDILIDKPQPGE